MCPEGQHWGALLEGSHTVNLGYFHYQGNETQREKFLLGFKVQRREEGKKQRKEREGRRKEGRKEAERKVQRKGERKERREEGKGRKLEPSTHPRLKTFPNQPRAGCAGMGP